MISPFFSLPSDLVMEQGGPPVCCHPSRHERNLANGLAIRPPAYSGSKSTICWEIPMLGCQRQKEHRTFHLTLRRDTGGRSFLIYTEW